MKLFGEYLLDQNAISEQQLLDALVAQIRQQPSICELVAEAKLMSTTNTLKVLAEQARKKCDFTEAASTLGLWNEDLAKDIEFRLAKVRTPLGRILVEKGAMTLENLSKFLDEFLGDLRTEDIAPSQNTQTATQAPPTTTQEAPSGSASTVAFLESFTEQKKNELSNLFEFLEGWVGMPEHDRKMVLDSSQDLIHFMLGASCLGQSTECEKIFRALEELFKRVASGQNTLTEESAIQMVSVAKKSLDLAWNFRCALSQGQASNGSSTDSPKTAELSQLLTHLDATAPPL